MGGDVGPDLSQGVLSVQQLDFDGHHKGFWEETSAGFLVKVCHTSSHMSSPDLRGVAFPKISNLGDKLIEGRGPFAGDVHI